MGINPIFRATRRWKGPTIVVVIILSPLGNIGGSVTLIGPEISITITTTTA